MKKKSVGSSVARQNDRRRDVQIHTPSIGNRETDTHNVPAMSATYAQHESPHSGIINPHTYPHRQAPYQGTGRNTPAFGGLSFVRHNGGRLSDVNTHQRQGAPSRTLRSRATVPPTSNRKYHDLGLVLVEWILATTG